MGGTGGAGEPGGPQAYAMSLTMAWQLGLPLMEASGTPRTTLLLLSLQVVRLLMVSQDSPLLTML